MPAFNRRFQLTFKFGLPVKAVFILLPLVLVMPMVVFTWGSAKMVFCLVIAIACIVGATFIIIQGEEMPFFKIKRNAKIELNSFTGEACEIE